MSLWEKIWTYFACVVFVILCFGSIWIAIDSYIFDNSCSASIGELDNSYIHERKRFLSSYSVSYKFNYDGKIYTGYQTIYNKPLIKETIVYFMPDEPQKNRLDRGRIFESLVTSFVMFIFLAQTIKRLRANQGM